MRVGTVHKRHFRLDTAGRCLVVVLVRRLIRLGNRGWQRLHSPYVPRSKEASESTGKDSACGVLTMEFVGASKPGPEVAILVPCARDSFL